MARGLRHFLLALQFFTRIPITGRLAAWVGFSPAMLNRASGHFPGVGWVVGAAGALVLWLAGRHWGASPLGALLAALLCTATTAWLTGAFHEDGLADTGDGLGGSVTRERALAIMKDSRIGSYGAVTLALVLLMKLTLLALLVQQGAGRAAQAMLAAHVLSRLAPLFLMRGLPYVSEAANAKSKPLAEAVSNASLAAGILWSIPAAGLMWHAQGTMATIAAMGAWLLMLLAVLRLLQRRLQGFTGDTMGALQQLCELALYLGLAWGAP